MDGATAGAIETTDLTPLRWLWPGRWSVTGAELRAVLQTLWGDEWRPKGASFLGVNVTSVTRWVTDEIPVPGPVEAAVKAQLHVEYMLRKKREAQTRVREKRAAR